MAGGTSIEKHKSDALAKLLEEFCKAYSLQKDVDLDDVELVCYEDKKRSIFYFRPKSREIKRYGTQVIQD